MAWCVVEKEKALEITFGQAFENVDGGIDLCENVFSAEITIAVLAGFEEDSGLPEEKLVRKWKDSDGQTHRHHASDPTRMLESPRP